MHCPDSDVGHFMEMLDALDSGSNMPISSKSRMALGITSCVGRVGRVGHQLRFSGKVSNCPTHQEIVIKSRMALGKMVLEESSNTRPTVQQHRYQGRL